jgi:hypothetical protein
VANHAPLTELRRWIKIKNHHPNLGWIWNRPFSAARHINQPTKPLSKLQVKAGLLTQPSVGCLNNPIVASLTYQINSIQSASASHNQPRHYHFCFCTCAAPSHFISSLRPFIRRHSPPTFFLLHSVRFFKVRPRGTLCPCKLSPILYAPQPCLRPRERPRCE